jgi:amidophosphoribosyltransferase
MCGFIGVIGADDAVREIYDGLVAVQHRGQDAAGILTYDGGRFHVKKGEGLVRDIFSVSNIERLKGSIGVGHVRYPTVGSGGGEDAQPFTVNFPFGIAMAHNIRAATSR